jgi:DNA-binding transcriptional regulator YiaG
MLTPREWLQKLRAERCISAVDFAIELGVSRMTVHRWERGDPPKLAQAADLARYAQVSLETVADLWEI